MNYKNSLAIVVPVIVSILLAACGGEQNLHEPSNPGSVIYSFPADGQSEISPKADIVLRFSHAITDEDLTGKIRISDGSGTVPYSVSAVDGGRSLLLSPNGELAVGTAYTIDFTGDLEAEGNRVVGTPNAMGPAGIQFTTRGALSGIAGLDNLGPEFAVAEMIPSASGFFRPMDFSTFRLRLTHPVHPEWKELGGSITLVDGSGETVPATVLVKDRYLTIDPCIPEDKTRCGSDEDALTPGKRYTVQVSNLPSLGGDTLDYSAEFTPKDTSPTVVLFQETIDSGLLAGTEPKRSILNDQIINGVTLNSVLQGVAGPSQKTGGLYAELAYAPSFPGDEPIPLRIPKGSLLMSSSLDVKVNGFVPIIDSGTGTIQQTGDIKVTMLSDATGYLYPNPYSKSGEAPRHVKLYMDVSMNTVEAQPNAALSQDLLGVELSGIAIVKGGILTIDAIGMVEPNLLGQEYTDSTIAFRIEADTNADVQMEALEQRTEDNTGPRLVSWMPGPDDALPGDRDQMQRPGDPIVLNFDEPLDPDTLAQGLALDDGSGALLTVVGGDLNARLDGTAVTLNPQGGLRHGTPYTVHINSTLTDLAGNSVASQNLTFALPELGDGDDSVVLRSPIALTTYPGFPCVTTATVSFADNTHGQCVDDAPDGPRGDVLPITTLPEDRPIVVVFSQSMNLDSINTDTFMVEKISDLSTPVGAGERVNGRLEKSNQRVRFYPDTSWETGSFYRYTMASGQDGRCQDGSVAFICGENGLALQTDLLVNPEDVGGPDMTIYFKGTATADTIFTPLRNLPIRDTNSNYIVDCESSDDTTCLEPFAHDPDPDNPGQFLPSANAAKLRVAGEATILGLPTPVRVGCPPEGEDCPKDKFIYQTYGLNTEVLGPALDEHTGERIGVRVLLYPTLLATTSTTVHLTVAGLFTLDEATGPQILRMRYAETPTAENPQGLVEGIIVEGEQGPVFKTEARLQLDAPLLEPPLGGPHDLYSKPFTLELESPIQFFDDGRMQIQQRNTNRVPIDVNIESLGTIPLEIPAGGVFLNFLSNPIKEIPEQY